MDLPSSDEVMCPKHDQRYHYFCDTCKELACLECLIIDHASQSHTYTNLEKPAMEGKKSTQALLTRLEKKLPELEESLGVFKQLYPILHNHSKQAIAEVQAFAAKIREEVTKEENHLVEEIRRESRQQTKDLNQTCGNLSESITHAQFNLETGSVFTKRSTDSEFLQRRAIVEKDLHTLVDKQLPSVPKALGFLEHAGGVTLGELKEVDVEQFIQKSIQETTSSSEYFSPRRPSQQKPKQKDIPLKDTASAGDIFAKFQQKPGDWKCETCLLNNKADVMSCVACMTPTPKTSSTSFPSKPLSQNTGSGVSVNPSSGGGFSFGISSLGSGKTSGFKFGAPPSFGSTTSISSAPAFALPSGAVKFGSTQSESGSKFGSTQSKSTSTTTMLKAPITSHRTSQFTLGAGDKALQPYVFGSQSPSAGFSFGANAEAAGSSAAANVALYQAQQHPSAAPFQTAKTTDKTANSTAATISASPTFFNFPLKSSQLAASENTQQKPRASASATPAGFTFGQIKPSNTMASTFGNLGGKGSNELPKTSDKTANPTTATISAHSFSFKASQPPAYENTPQKPQASTAATSVGVTFSQIKPSNTMTSTFGNFGSKCSIKLSSVPKTSDKTTNPTAATISASPTFFNFPLKSSQLAASENTQQKPRASASATPAGFTFGQIKPSNTMASTFGNLGGKGSNELPKTSDKTTNPTAATISASSALSNISFNANLLAASGNTQQKPSPTPQASTATTSACQSPSTGFKFRSPTFGFVATGTPGRLDINEYHDKDDDDVIFVSEKQPTPDQRARAKALMLPPTYFLYEDEPPCPGCVGCDPEDLAARGITLSKHSPSSKVDGGKNKGSTFGSLAADTPSLLSTKESSQPIFGTSTISFASLSSDKQGTFAQGGHKGFSFPKAGALVFDNNNNKGSTAEGQEYDPHFDPIVELPELVDVKTGEEDEKVMYQQRARLYRFAKDLDVWKERGIGDVKLLRHRDTGLLRLIMRREQVLKLCANHRISTDLMLNSMESSDRTWIWYATDYAEGKPCHEQFAIKFKTPKLANEFKQRLEELQAARREEEMMASGSPEKADEAYIPKAAETEKTDATAREGESTFFAFGASTSTSPTTQPNNEKPESFSLADMAKSKGSSFSFHLDVSKTTVASLEKTPKPKSPGLMKSPRLNKSDGNEYYKGDEGNHIYFEPVVQLPEYMYIAVKTGEEDEISRFSYRAKLFRFDKEMSQWKERGIGDMKLLYNPSNGKYRIVMRREQVFKVCANHYITPEFKLERNAGSTKSWVWMAMDSSENQVQVEQFAVRFKTEEAARQFKDAIDAAQEDMKTGDKELVKETTEDDSVDFKERQEEGQGDKTARVAIEDGDDVAKGNRDVDEEDIDEEVVEEEQDTVEEQNLVFTKAQQNDNIKIQQDRGAIPEEQDKTASEGPVEVEGCDLAARREEEMMASGSPEKADEAYIPKAAETEKTDATAREGESTFFAFGASTSTTQPSPEKTPNPKSPGFMKSPTMNKSGDNEYVVELLECITVKTGEEDEISRFRHRANLFRFDKETSQWKERGTGDIKLLYNPSKRKYRIVMRREQVFKVCANHYVTPELKLEPNAGSTKSWVWMAMDISENRVQVEQFAVRFKTEEAAQQFKDAIDAAQEDMKTGDKELMKETTEDDSVDFKERHEDHDDVAKGNSDQIHVDEEDIEEVVEEEQDTVEEQNLVFTKAQQDDNIKIQPDRGDVHVPDMPEEQDKTASERPVEEEGCDQNEDDVDDDYVDYEDAVDGQDEEESKTDGESEMHEVEREGNDQDYEEEKAVEEEREQTRAGIKS